MSDIRGNGYGDKHHWLRIDTLQRDFPVDRMTYFICRDCKRDFWHRYHVIKDIFEAMKAWGVPEECGGAINVLDFY